MMGVCRRYARDEDTAKDMLQEGFIKIFDKMHLFKRDGSFEGWMRRIMVNTSIDHFRKAKKDPLLVADDARLKDEEPYEDVSEDESIYSQLKINDVVDAVEDLSPAYQTVFNLYVMENYSHKEIAEILGISEGTSKSNLAKAKRNLKKILLKRIGTHNET
jgi:RNA polymerase sigma-70 factor (ECF subfamily)